MKNPLQWLALGACVLGCNTTIRAGSTGGSNDGRLLSSTPDASAATLLPPPVPPVDPPAATLPEAAAPSPSAATDASSADAGGPLVARCPEQFSDARFAHCKWSTGLYRYCGGAAPLDDQPREGCVCNECAHDRDCTARRGGKCLVFGDDACGPPAHGCVYAGDPCGTPSGCKPPNRCLHDRVGHVACIPPPVPHM